MALVFIDSFAHWSTDSGLGILQKYSSGDNSLCSTNTDPAFIRTGTQSLQVSSEAFGTAPTIHFSNRITMTAGVAWLCNSSLSEGGAFFEFYNLSDNDAYVVNFNEDGSVYFSVNGVQEAISAPGIISSGNFYYVELQCTFEKLGAFEVRVNTVPVLAGNITVNNIDATGAETFFIPGSAFLDIFYNDLYVLDSTGSHNTTFLGAVQIWAIYPDENETPLDWTPLSGTNFSEVNQHPPPGDSAYVSAGTAGDIDQYHYTPSGPTGSYTISGIQHGMCARLDSGGAHTIASQIGTNTGSGPSIGSASVGSDYVFVLQPWDTNPETGEPFAVGDFATTFVGPNITT